jgi:hypothetical protein
MGDEADDQLAYAPEDDAGVRELEKAETDEERLEIEKRLVEQTDNGVKDTDPPQPGEADDDHSG